jgi:nucleotide-binding universal stress UspA family protein
MKVIAAINGTITAESMAFCALKYAQGQGFSLLLLHIENEKDDLDDVRASIGRITTQALAKEVETEAVILQGAPKKALRSYLSGINADVIFCSTRKHKSFISGSFSEALTRMGLDLDIAVVRIVNINAIVDIDTMILSIKADKLSVKKFAFFASLASAFQADGEIYSVSSMSRRVHSRIDMHAARARLGLINYNLRHYLKLAHFMPFTLHIEHAFTENEAESILTHIAKSQAQLVVIGARRLSVTSIFEREMPIEKLMREASVNTIAYYPKEA